MNNLKNKTNETYSTTKDIIRTCIGELKCWINTNDLTSPTHNSDGDIALSEFNYLDLLTEDECNLISNALSNLRYAILNATKKYGNQD